MRNRRWNVALALTLVCLPTSAFALEAVGVERVDGDHVRVTWTDKDPVSISVAEHDTVSGKGMRVTTRSTAGEAVFASPEDQRRYFILRDGGDGSVVVAAERVVPLERGSNFRDLGGYVGAGGKRVVWGRIFRSGALPMLSERDYRLLASLNLTTIVDLRALEERTIAPDALDDRTGALFVSNDYSIVPLLTAMQPKPGRAMYAGTEIALAPQYRAIFRRLLANDGAILFHCSAGQDRTGIAAALILSALGVDRATIVADYHLSTQSRRPENEMPKLNPEEFPGNPMAKLYAVAQARPGGMKAEPLYTSAGKSHLAEFLDYLDQRYGGVEYYLESQLGIGRKETDTLRRLYLH
jgi:protein-tyrosine phosphatase